MIVRIEYHNGDWDVMDFPNDRGIDSVADAIRLGAKALKGKIDGGDAIIPVAAIRCARELRDGEVRDY